MTITALLCAGIPTLARQPPQDRIRWNEKAPVETQQAKEQKMKSCLIKIVRLMLSVGTAWFVTGTAHAGPALPPPVSEPTPSESPFEASIGFPVWIPFPEGDVGAHLPSGGEGVDRVSAHIRPLNNVGTFGYIIPLSIELQKSRWLFQASGYYLNFSTYVDPHGPLYRSGTLDWNSGLVDVAVGYRVLDIPCFSLDLWRAVAISTSVSTSRCSQPCIEQPSKAQAQGARKIGCPKLKFNSTTPLMEKNSAE